MKKSFYLTSCAIALTCTLCFNSQKKTSTNPVTLATVEALSKDEVEDCSNEICTKIASWANCYKPNGDWAATRIVSVQEYTRSSCMQICQHVYPTRCPSGTSER